MEAAGLLDAWLTPDGRLLDTREHDTFVIAGSNPAAPAGRSLANALAPAVDRNDPRVAELTDDTITAKLWELFHNLACRGFYVQHSDHLSDRGAWQLTVDGCHHPVEFSGPVSQPTAVDHKPRRRASIPTEL